MNQFKKGVEALTDEFFAFIEKELGISKEMIAEFDDDELNEKVYEPMCDIEIAEIPLNDDEEESERCIMASDIVTVLGNSLAEANGYLEEKAE